MSGIVLACVIFCSLSAFAVLTDQAAAERVLGPQWKHLSSRAGIIFTGAVLSTGRRLAPATAPLDSSDKPRLGGNFIELHFRVDRAIAGVKAGQILTIREWAGASSRQPALRSGERVLLFLYPPSRLGLTSPVAGAQGQIRLDSSGQNVIGHTPSARSQSPGAPDRNSTPIRRLIPVSQLERAIRAARGE